MIKLCGRIGQGGADVVCFEIRKVGEDFLFAGACRQHIQDISHTDAHAANAGATVALLGANRNPG